MSYNGFSNKETWLVNVWYSPESRNDVYAIRDMLEEQYDQIPEGALKDMVDIMAINWDELLEHFEEEETEEEY